MLCVKYIGIGKKKIFLNFPLLQKLQGIREYKGDSYQMTAQSAESAKVCGSLR